MEYYEFDERFDVLYNNISSNQAPGLNAYEKSVFLTKAQDELLKNYFNPKGNKYQEGFDGSQKRQIDFSSITKKYSKNQFGSPVFDSRAHSVELPEGIMMFITEQLKVKRNNDEVILTVLPITFLEYNQLMNKPYKRPLRNQVWRLITSAEYNNVDLICAPNDIPVEYTARYVRKPKPIIVGDLDGLTINGYTFSENPTGLKTNGCELDTILHEEILQRAVEIAKLTWASSGSDNAQLATVIGQRSE
jgi:hypothetical protein